jgi:hypothetical protein
MVTPPDSKCEGLKVFQEYVSVEIFRLKSCSNDLSWDLVYEKGKEIITRRGRQAWIIVNIRPSSQGNAIVASSTPSQALSRGGS